MSKKDYLMIGKLKPNTFIGGVGGAITTKELLAAKLSVTAGQIQSFEIDAQNNVSCYIGVNYSINIQAFLSDPTLTRWIDEDELCTGLGTDALRSAVNLEEISLNGLTVLGQSVFAADRSILYIKLENVTTLVGQEQFGFMIKSKYFELPKLTNCVRRTFDSVTSAEYIYIPRCVTLGNVGVNNLIFDNVPVDCIVYLDPINWTSNGGSPNLDLQYLIDRGNDVRAVTNFDTPTIPINLTKVNDYGVVVDISWVQPIGSTNAIDYYQIYINGVYNGRTNSNETTYRIENLEQYSFYTIQIVACDYFYNQSYSEMLNIETGENTAVSQITDLAVDTMYSDAVIVDFTTPTSIYTVSYYEVYLDNVFYKNKTTHPILILNLTNGQIYGIKIIAVDVNGNKSEYSSVLNVLINGLNPFIPIQNIISEYKFENNVLDTVGSNNATPTNVTYIDNGGVDLSGVFNGTSSRLNIPDSPTLSFTDGVGNDLPFSISFLVMYNDVSIQPISIVKKSIPLGENVEYQLAHITSNALRFQLCSNGSYSDRLILEGQFPTVLGRYYHIITTYNGSKSINGMSIYIDGVKVIGTDASQGNYTGMTRYTEPISVNANASNSRFLDGSSDCLRFWNKELTSGESLELATKELAGIDINP